MRVGWIVAILAGVLMAGCSKKESTPGEGALTKVTLALNWVAEPEFGGIYAARLNGAFARHGLEVEVQGGGAGVPVVQRVAAGQVEFGIASADEIVMARSRGADVVGIFATYQTCPQAIMVHGKRGLRELGEVFKSGTLAMEPGLPYAEYLRSKYPGGGAKIVPYDGGIARFLAEGDFAQQCFVTSEPIAARRQGADVRIFLVAEAGYNPYTAVVITRGEYLRRRREVVRAMVRALREGWRSYLDDPKGANEAMGRLNPSMDGATFAAAAEAQKSLIDGVRPVGAMNASRWETLIGQLAGLKLIEKSPGVGGCFWDGSD